MKKAIATGLIGLIALGGTAAVAAPSAIAQEDTSQSASAGHRSDSRDARLDALVADGTLTEAQADAIRERFADGPRHHLSAEDRAEQQQLLMDVLGVSEDELRAARQSGQTLADVATANGVAVQAVIDALVAAANTHIDEKVADGTLDASRAAEIRETLVERVTARVNGERPERPAGFDGRRGPGRFGNGAPGEALADA